MISYWYLLGENAAAVTGVPMAQDEGHWNLDVFGDELMVAGWINPFDKTFSDVTLTSMADLGYQVNYWAADESYVLYWIKQGRQVVRSGKAGTEQESLRCHITPRERSRR